MVFRTALILALLGSLVLTLSAQEKPAPAKPAEVQLAIEKGLFFVEYRSMVWWKKRSCATCHEGQMLLFASNVAKERGIAVDQDKLDFWTDRWVLVDALARNEKRNKLNGLGMDTAPYVLLHRDRSRDSSKERAIKWADVLKDAFANQLDNGSWSTEAHHVTPRMALALADLETSTIPFSTEFRGEIARRRERTDRWIRNNKLQMPEKTESLAGWFVYEHLRGDKDRARKLRDELISRRCDDRGWGIKKGDPSHLLITSVVLYSLKSCGLPNDDPVVSTTQRFLLDRQSEDGRWCELGRHFGPDKYHPSYDVWTSGFAIAALSLTLPKLVPDAPRQYTPDPKLMATAERLRKTAAEGYKGRLSSAGDPAAQIEQVVPKDK
jgi:hypothetical protein